jgi:mono/diheme cytochrome c family protein
MMTPRLCLLAAVLATTALGADQAVVERGQKEESRSCVPCHSLRLIHSQRLSKAAWNKELDKMAGWGTLVNDREALLEYLMANYGDDKPLPAPAMSK